MAMIQLPQDFKYLLKLLTLHNVEYLLIGGYAVGYHGYPRATAAMDIWIANRPENARKMVKVIKEFGFNVPELSQNLFLEKKKVIRMGQPPVRIEILTEIFGVEFDECYQNRIRARLDDIEVNIIDYVNLIKNKQPVGRAKDLNDLEHLSKSDL